jgi:hypothetical protein
VSHRWRLRGTSISPSAFEQFLWQDVQTQMIAESTSMRDRLGLFQFFAHDPMSGHGHLSALVPSERMRSGWPVEALVMFADMIFETWDIRKLYFECMSLVADDFASAVGELLVEEGRLKAHHYWNDRYWDNCIYAMYRDTWRVHRHRLTPPSSPGRGSDSP